MPRSKKGGEAYKSKGETDKGKGGMIGGIRDKVFYYWHVIQR